MARDVFQQVSPAGRGTLLLPLEMQVDRGTTDIDDSVQTETTAWNILTIAADSDYGMQDVEVWFDLNKATTGYGAVETTATINFKVARQVDGTNYRTDPDLKGGTTAISGTNAAADAGQAAVVHIGDIPAGETVRIYADMSADATSDIELPRAVFYKSRGTPTITDVAAA